MRCPIRKGVCLAIAVITIKYDIQGTSGHCTVVGAQQAYRRKIFLGQHITHQKNPLSTLVKTQRLARGNYGLPRSRQLLTLALITPIQKGLKR